MDIQLIGNSIILCVFATLLSVVAGIHISVFRLLLPKHFRVGLDVFSLILWITPPFLYVESWMRMVQEPLLGIHPLSKISCVAVMAMSQWPIAYFLINATWRNQGCAEKIYSTGLRNIEFIRHIFLPMARPGLISSSLLVFAYSWSSFTIPSLFNQKVISSQLWITFSATLEANTIWIPAIIHSAIPILIYLLVVRHSKFDSVSRKHSENCIYWASLFGHFIALVFCCISILILISTSYFGIAQMMFHLGDAQSIVSSVKANSTALKNSFILGLILTSMFCALGITLNRWKLARHLWIIWFIPGICIGVIIAQLLNSTFLYRIYVPGVEIVLIAISAKTLPLALFLFGTVKIQEKNENQIHFFKLLKCSKWQSFSLIDWPTLRHSVPYITMAILPLILWDIETFILFVPPDGETASMRVFNLLHYGHNDQIMGLCISLILIASFIVLLSYLISRIGNLKFPKGKWANLILASFLLVSLFLSGCGGSSSSKFRSEKGKPETTPIDNSTFFNSVLVIGTKGNAPEYFQKPRSVTVSKKDDLFVSDMTGRIQRFSSKGEFILFWQIEDISLGRPKGMNIDFDGNIIVIEPHYSRINHFTHDGELIRYWGTKGKKPGELDLVRNIIKTQNGKYILCEFGGHDRIQWFNDDGSYANHSVGNNGVKNGEFDRPESLAFDSNGNILVADSCNHRIQAFSPSGEFIESHGSPGSNQYEFSYPYDVKVDHKGNIYVCEYGNSRIQIFDKDWKFRESVGKQGRNPGEFFNPWMISFDSKENLYVADSMNHRVQKLIRPSTWILEVK